MGRAVKPVFNQSGLLFVPARWQRANIIRWLKRVHAWTGFWGAILFFLLGLSGVLLNHRSIWKIDTGEPLEVSAMHIAVRPGLIRDEKALGRWAQREFDLSTEPRAPRGEGGPGAPRGNERKRFMGKERAEPLKWVQMFNHPNGRLTVTYVPGSASVAVRQDAQNALGLIKNLHKGSGVGLAWVLFLDSIAGALIAMSVTGFLLWSRLHGTRILAGGIIAASLAAAISSVWPWLL